eukprot:scaffold216378_cov19-Prasinocladus_malaysianus.AAC.1
MGAKADGVVQQLLAFLPAGNVDRDAQAAAAGALAALAGACDDRAMDQLVDEGLEPLMAMLKD